MKILLGLAILITTFWKSLFTNGLPQQLGINSMNANSSAAQMERIATLCPEEFYGDEPLDESLDIYEPLDGPLEEPFYGPLDGALDESLDGPQQKLKRCLRIRVRLRGDAYKHSYDAYCKKPGLAAGVYKRSRKLVNGKPAYNKKTDTPFGKRYLTIWWDPKKNLDGKVSPKGDDRSHWKLGKFDNKVSFLDTYNSLPSYPRVEDRRHKWSYFHRPGDWFDKNTWVDADPGDITVRCIKRG